MKAFCLLLEQMEIHLWMCDVISHRLFGLSQAVVEIFLLRLKNNDGEHNKCS